MITDACELRLGEDTVRLQGLDWNWSRYPSSEPHTATTKSLLVELSRKFGKGAGTCEDIKKR